MKRLILASILLIVCQLLTAQTYDYIKKFTDPNRAYADLFSFAVDVEGEYLVSTNTGDDHDENEMNPLDSAGSALIYKKVNNEWTLNQKIASPDRMAGDAFGTAVAMQGNELALTSVFHPLDSLGNNSMIEAGAVYIYNRNAQGQYVFNQKIVAFDRSIGASYGASIDINGEWMVVGALYEYKDASGNGTIGNEPGAAYIYRKNTGNGNWEFFQKVSHPSRNDLDRFGFTSVIDGAHMAIGAYSQDYDLNELNYIENAGAVYTFEFNGTSWVFQNKLVKTSRTEGDNFGYGIDILEDRMIIGAPFRALNAGNNNQGVIDFYQYSGSSWTTSQGTMIYPHANLPFPGDFNRIGAFGATIRMKYGKVFIGTPGESNFFASPNRISSGTVFQLDLVGNTYTYATEFTASAPKSFGIFGFPIAVDSNVLVVGAPGETQDSLDAGALLDSAGAFFVFEQCIHSNVPQITPSLTSICGGDSVQLVISSSSDLHSAKEWYWYTGTYGSGTLVDSTDTIWVSPSVTTTYTVAGEGYCVAAESSDSSQSITITVNPSPTITANASPTTTLCSGESVTLTGGGASTYVWDNGVSDGVSFTPTATTTYKVVGTDVNGCVDSTTINITVSAGLTAGINYTGSTTVCSGTPVTLNGTGATTYAWNNGVSDGVAFTPLVTNTYTVTGSSPSGCSDTEDITITVIAGPSVSASSGVTTICEGTSLSLSASGADSYSWDNSLGAGQSHTVSPTVTTTYTVTGTQAATMCTDTDMITITVNNAPNILANALPNDSLCLGESLTLTGSGGVSYTWNQGVVDGIVFTPTLGSIDYIVNGTDASGCIGKDTVNVKVFSQPVISASASASGPICSGSQVILNGFGGVTYTWDSSGVDVGIVDNVPFFPPVGNNIVYTVTGVDANGCSGTAIQSISVNESPSVTAFSSAGGASLCDGDSVQLTAIGNGQSYTWDNGVQDGVYFMPNLGTTLFTVTANSANGCTGQASVSVVVNPQDDATITPILPLCGGVPIQTLIAATPGGVWQGVGVDASSGEFDASVSGQGVHEIVYTTSGTCGDSDTTYIEVYPELLVAVQEDSVCFGDVDGDIAVSANGVPPYNYLWDNDETTTSLSGLGEGIYNVTVKDSNNCIVDVSVNVYLTETCDYHLFIPNIFSPNSDGNNDELFVRGKGFQTLDFIVFDRWGNKMFESTDKEIGWDGTFNGTKVSSGVYVYYVEVEYYNGNKEVLEGNVCVTF